MKFENSKTIKNLRTAFLAESGARTEYEFFATQAMKEGFIEVAKTLNLFAENERAHSEVWFKLYHGIAGTTDNLRSSAELENYERTKMYAEFAKTAKEEGFTDIAELFDGVAKIEAAHERTYIALEQGIKDGSYIKSEDTVVWKCANCGHIHIGTTPPKTCPVCSHPQGYFFRTQNEQ